MVEVVEENAKHQVKSEKMKIFGKATTNGNSQMPKRQYKTNKKLNESLLKCSEEEVQCAVRIQTVPVALLLTSVMC
jgi:hypothetical protein